MRKLVRTAVASVAAVVVGALGADVGAAIYAEYRLARTIRSTAGLSFDPWVAILGFPFIPQAARHRYSELEIKAVGVENPVVGPVTLEATMHDIDLADPQRPASWVMRPDADLPLAKLESRIIIDSRRVGAFIGVKDLTVEAPAVDTNDATGGTTESGISGSSGLVFTGTPTEAGFDKLVSVTVDLSVTGPDSSTLVITPTGVVTGPNTADEQVPEQQRAAVLEAFRAAVPGQRLPFGLKPTTEGARGSDIIIEGIATDVTVRLDGFPAMTAAVSLAAIVGALGLAAGAGVLINRRSGTFRVTDRAVDTGGLGLSATGPTVVHFTAAWCGPCAAVRRVVDQVCAELPQVTHLEIDIDSDPQAAQSLSVLSLPTTFIFDADGRQRYRASGVPAVGDLRVALTALLA